MKITILAFGIAKDLLATHSLEIEFQKEISVAELKKELENLYPKMKDLKTYMIAVNNEYAEDNQHIHTNDEIAIIPPVSGG